MNDKTYLLLTVDTEASMYRGKPLDIEKMVYGKIGNEEWGINRIMNVCDSFGVKATFFVDVYEYKYFGEGTVKNICLQVKNRGFDVQLHTHPNWIYSDKPLMWNYSLDEQIKIIEEGKNLFYSWFGEYPIAHRAGSFGANYDTLLAVKRNGIPIDCSLASHYPFCKLSNNLLRKNAISLIGGVVEVPVTVFTQIKFGKLRAYRTLDINADTLSELINVAQVAKEKNLRTVTLLLHSFSFLKRNKNRTEFCPNLKDLYKFERFLDYVKNDPDLEVITIKDFYHLHNKNPELVKGKDFIPNSGIIRTSIRAYKHFDKGIKNKIFVFLTLLMGLLIIALASFFIQLILQ